VQAADPARPATRISRTLEELFASLRSGAANVAGVSYQVAVSALLLAAGRAGAPGLRVSAVRPEGLEDVDCVLDDGSLLLVQTKERGPGARAIAIAELAEIIAHSAEALRLTDSQAPGDAGDAAQTSPGSAGLVAGQVSRFAVVTDGRFGGSLPETGWMTSLADKLTALPDGGEVSELLVAALEAQLARKGLPVRHAGELLARTYLVVAPYDLAAQTIRFLCAGLQVPAVLASIIRAELLRDLGEMAARQRGASLGTAERRTRSDLDALAARLGQAVDVPSLEEAVRAGVCEPADYASPPPVDAVGFLSGVDVTPAHIAAGLDVVRPEETATIVAGLADRRQVVIAGPSGSGKSALLWRSARLLERGPRILRVLRVADSADAELLVRHVRRQIPHRDMPVLVCADDLGRARMAAWPDACRRLSELSGVLILGAVRREDLTPELSADAVVVDPHLTDTAAGLIYDAVRAVGLPAVLEREEALQEAGGLLMEFIALITTGRRIRDVLAVQVAALSERSRRLEREALRLVCAAHTLGFAVPADALPTALGAEPDQIGDALSRLAGEHLLAVTGQAWRGLHDLRTELLLGLLHDAPPPTLAATYGRVLPLLPEAAHASAARRAAVLLARSAATEHAGWPASERLVSLQELLRPVAEGIGRQLRQLPRQLAGDDHALAEYAAALLEAADRLDTVAYAHAILPLVAQQRPATLDVATLAGLAYDVAVDGVAFDIEGLQGVVRLARKLPARTSPCARIAGASLPPAMLASLAARADLATAVRLCEAAEGLLSITAEQAAVIYRAHVPVLPSPPGSGNDIEQADRRAQLTASLASLAQLRGPGIAAAFGPPLARAEDAVASDPYGCRVELAFEPAQRAPDTVAGRCRPYLYDTEQMLVLHAVAFTRTDGDVPVSAYHGQPGEDPSSVNAQVVLLARRLFDACPEADLINAELWQANQGPLRVLHHEEGVNSLRAGVLPRARTISHNIAFQAAVAEAVSAGSWTSRLRSQAQLARQLVILLRDLPARMRPTDNQRRRREWTQAVQEAAAAVAALPGRPASRPRVLGAAQAAALARPAADLDEELRARDEAKDALSLLADALMQVVRGLADPSVLRGAGSRLAEVPGKLRQARRQGAPSFAGIGDTLPQLLDTLATLAGRLLTALGQPRLDRMLRSRTPGPDEIDALLTELARDVCEHDSRAVASRMATAGATAEAVIDQDPAPTPPWQSLRTVILVPADTWPAAVDSLQGWTEAERQAAGMSGRVLALPIQDRALIPTGLHFFGSIGKVLPLPYDELEELSTALGMPLHGGSTSAVVEQLSRQLVQFSYEQARRVNRDTAWHPVPHSAPAPDQIAGQVRTQFAAVLAQAENNRLTLQEARQLAAARSLLKLCQAVSAETGHDAGLAHQLADIDITALTTQEIKPQADLFLTTQLAALEADELHNDPRDSSVQND